MKKLFFIIVTIQMLFGIDVIELKKGDIVEDNVQRLEKKYYKVGIRTRKDIRVKLTNLDQDIDLYVRTETLNDIMNNVPIEERVPTIKKNHCFSSYSNTEDEECRYTISGPAPGDYDAIVYIMVYGFKASNYTLEVSEVEQEKIDLLTSDTTKGKIKETESKQYKIEGKAGETIKVSLFDLTADADLRLKVGSKARRNHFDCKSIHKGTKADSCSVTLKENKVVFIQVYGVQDADYSIKRELPNNNDDQALIDKAKKHCRGKDNSSSSVLCSNEKEIVYILTEKTDYQSNIIHYASYRVSIAKNNEFVNLLKEHSEPMWQQPHTSEYFINKLENTLMYGTVTVTQEADERGSYNFYYKEKSVLSFVYIEQDGNLRKHYTSDNGNKLHVEYNKDIALDSASKCQEIYNISNPAEPKLLNKKCTPLYPNLAK